MSDQGFWSNRAMMGLVMTEIGADGSRPVDVGVTRPASALRTVECAAKSFASIVFEPPQQVVDHFANDLAGGFEGFARNGSPESNEIGNQVHVGLKRGKEFRLQHEGLQV